MTAAWVVRALAAAVLLGVAAAGLEQAAAWCRLPRRWGWAAAMALTIVLPVASLLTPELLPADGLVSDELLLTGTAGRSLPMVAAPSPTAAPVPSLAEVLPLLWAAASAAMLLVLAGTYVRLRRVRDRAEAGVVDGVPVRVVERAGPAAVGLLHPAVLLPRWAMSVPAAERAVIVRHEREHVRAGDPWLLAASALAVAAMPWNPALWWQHRRLRLAVETDCDARVLAGGIGAAVYGDVLIRGARRGAFSAVLSPGWTGRPSYLERRILAMTSTRPTHPLRRSLPIAGLSLAAALAACAVSQPHPTPVAASKPLPTTQAGADSYLWLRRDMGDGTEMLGWWRAGDPLAQLGFTMSYNNDGKLTFPRGMPPHPWPIYAEITIVMPGSNAAASGMAVGDTVIAINGVDARQQRMMDRSPTARYTLRLRRQGQERDVSFTLGTVPAPPPIQ
ncbi:MAG TPA: M56 family metallopeptidase [Longimicrobiaceae bacterium]|nr:M56 family metallopeptidase [Longimicrobiaceae bacterium]